MDICVDFYAFDDKRSLRDIETKMPVIPAQGSTISLGGRRQEWIVVKIKWRIMDITSFVSVFLTPCPEEDQSHD